MTPPVIISGVLADLIAESLRYRETFHAWLRDNRGADATRRARYAEPYDLTRAAARDQFARDNGWRYVDREFSLAALGRRDPTEHRPGAPIGYDSHEAWFGSALAPLLDHVEYFVGGDGRPTAIVSHPYPSRHTQYARIVTSDPEAVAAELEELNIDVTELECPSWYNPGGTIAILFRPRSSTQK